MSIKKRRVLKDFRIDEISLVDKPAQAGARFTLLKRDSADDSPDIVKMAQPILLSDHGGHSHILDGGSQGGMTSWENEHSHPWAKMPDGSVRIGASAGHTHEVVLKRDNTMEETEKQELLARVAKAESLAKLNDEQRSFYAGLNTEDQDAFLKSSDEDRQTKVDLSKSDDPVIYKSADGAEYRKSEAKAAELAKRVDAQDAKLKESEQLRKRDAFAKRAESELSNLPGSEDTKIAVLMAVEGIDGAAELFKAANEGLTKAFERAGTAGS